MMNFFTLSKDLEKTVPELTPIQRTVIAKNITDLSTYGKCHLDPVPIVRFLKITGTINEAQQETLLKLIDKAIKY